MKVSVLVMTYNHARFVQQALESVLMQQVNFDYEILISEDCSTDATRETVIHFHKTYPEKSRLLLSEQNLRSNEIVARGLRAARGQYIALLDGDDYWTRPDKLQKQVDYLDSHPDCAICFHNAVVVQEDKPGREFYWTPPDQPEISGLEEMWLGNFIATCSTMFRNGLIGEIPEWYSGMFPITDWPLHLLNAEKGKIGYINDVMGVYRYHRGGLYSPFSERGKQAETLKFYRTMNRNFEFRYDQMIRIAISKYFIEWAEEYLNRGDLAQARACYRTCLTGRPVNRFIPLSRLLILGLRLSLPARPRRPRVDEDSRKI